jgi:hypothetical protein
MWVNRGMPPPFDPSRLTLRQKDELIRDLARVVEAQAARIAALEARLAAAAAAAAAAKPPKTPANSSLPPSRGHKATRPPPFNYPHLSLAWGCGGDSGGSGGVHRAERG